MMLEDTVLEYLEGSLDLSFFRTWINVFDVNDIALDFWRLELYFGVKQALSNKEALDGFVRARVRSAWLYYQWRLSTKIETNF